ncbi:hypothetical protein ACHAW5_004061 [Stephanodiscus triporus]|uniref:Uncharacterized protein n=1 Tax=Stephanodiscus triporus TaxID=2934178 RepID=A0ABD3QHT2_9STRA
MFPISITQSVDCLTDVDVSVRENTSAQSDETNGTKSILRRRHGHLRAQKKIDRSVSWRNTIDIYEERGNHVSESSDAREDYGGDSGRNEYGERTIDLEVDTGLMSVLNPIHPGETNVRGETLQSAIGDETDGFDIQHVDHQQVKTRQMPDATSMKTPPPPPPTMGPKPTMRKQPLSTFAPKALVATRRAKKAGRARGQLSSNVTNVRGETLQSAIGDEADDFDIQHVDHQQMKTWQMPDPTSMKTPPPPPPTMGPKLTMRKQPLPTFTPKSFMATRRAKKAGRARGQLSISPPMKVIVLLDDGEEEEDDADDALPQTDEE